MRYAIETEFLGSTNILVKTAVGRLTVAWDSSLGTVANHEHAARVFALERGWLPRSDGGSWGPGRWVGGWNADGTGLVFVWVSYEN